MIEREDVDKVRERTRIEEIVGEHVALRSAGVGSLKGLCPFHDERTPSFHVRPHVGRWHCFGCGEGGDVISFIMKLDGLGFAEAVEYLAGRAGITLRYVDGGGQRRGDEPGKRQRLLEANRVAAEFYAEQLLTPAAAAGREFLAQRSFDRDAAQLFGVGFAPSGWDGLLRHLRGRGFTEPELVASGLVSQGQRGVYDRFRGRLIWPIRDVTGETIGFGARKLFEEDQGPKYLNTPETAVYQKSKVLYGIDLARRSIAKERQIVVVEGYTDVMAAHLSGVTTAVATCGTAFGSEHVRVVRRMMGDGSAGAGVQLASGVSTGGEVIFTFDGDAAGQKAALRAFGEDQKFSAQTFVAVSPDGLDPCDLRLQRGPHAIVDLVRGRVPLFEFVLRTAVEQHDLNTAEGRVAALRQSVPIVAQIRDIALRGEYARTLAGMIGIDHAQVDAALAAASRAAGRSGAPRTQGGPAPSGVISHGRAGGPSRASDPVVRLEREVLEAVLQHPDLVPIDLFDAMDSGAFTIPVARSVHDAIRAAGGVGAVKELTPAQWLDRVSEAAPEAVRATIDELAVTPLPADRAETVEGYVRGVVTSLVDMLYARHIAQVRSQLKRLDAEHEQDTAKQQEILAQLAELERRRRALKSPD